MTDLRVTEQAGSRTRNQVPQQMVLAISNDLLDSTVVAVFGKEPMHLVLSTEGPKCNVFTRDQTGDLTN